MTGRDGGLALGVDVGTSGVRIAAVDAAGGLIHMTTASMPAPQRAAGRVTQDARIWCNALDAAMAAMAAVIELSQVRAVAVDGTSGTVLAVDAAGAPLGLASLYNDLCTPEIVDTIARLGAPNSAAQGANSALGRAIELARRFFGAARILHQADWIAAQLSDRFDVSDESNALKTGYDRVVRGWRAWIEATGMARKLLPNVSPVGRVVARTARRPFGLSADALVVTGASDRCGAC